MLLRDRFEERGDALADREEPFALFFRDDAGDEGVARLVELIDRNAAAAEMRDGLLHREARERPLERDRLAAIGDRVGAADAPNQTAQEVLRLFDQHLVIRV